jgi:Transposase DDE domain group 1
MLAHAGPARRWEPRKLRLRIFSAAGRLVRGSRRLRLRLAARWPWTPHITTAISRLQALAPG